MMSYKFSLVILAAGYSQRMGSQKLALMYSQTNTFVENIANVFNQLQCVEMVLLVNKAGLDHINKDKFDFPGNLKVLLNEFPGYERFYSIKMGMKEIEFKQRIFIVNVDNPFVNIEINSALLENIGEADFIYPTYNGKGGHPVLITENIAKDIISQNQDQLNFREFLKKYKKKTLEVFDKRVLININTPEEYKSTFSNFPIIDLES